MRRISAARSAALRVTRFACCNCGGSAWPSAAIARLESRMAMITGFIVTSLLVKDFEHVIACFLATHHRELLDQPPLHLRTGFFSSSADQICSISQIEHGLNRRTAQLRVLFVVVNLYQRGARFLATKRPKVANGALPHSAVAFCSGNMN